MEQEKRGVGLVGRRRWVEKGEKKEAGTEGSRVRGNGKVESLEKKRRRERRDYGWVGCRWVKGGWRARDRSVMDGARWDEGVA